MESFDFTDYILRYDCLYNTDHIFTKGSFDHNDDHLAPIVYNCIGSHYQDPSCNLGFAILEKRDDGIVAKCNFAHHDYGQIAKDLVVNTKEYGLSVYANGIEYATSDQPSKVKKILKANVMAVILVPIERMPRVKEE